MLYNASSVVFPKSLPKILFLIISPAVAQRMLLIHCFEIVGHFPSWICVVVLLIDLFDRFFNDDDGRS
jgi:hypothetical protein